MAYYLLVHLAFLMISLTPGLAGLYYVRRQASTADDDDELFGVWKRSVNVMTIFSGVVFVIIYVAGGENALYFLFVLPLFLGLFFASWMRRRVILEERCGFFGYLSFLLRFQIASGYFAILLLIAPWIVADSPRPVLMAAGLGLLLLSLVFGFRAIYLCLLRAEPWQPPEELIHRMREIEAGSTPPPPELRRIPLGRVRFFGAFAVPHSRKPTVLFTSSMLESFPPGEIAAIYAHEISHLEDLLRPRIRRKLDLIAYPLVLSSVTLVPWLMSRPGWYLLGGLGWGLFVLWLMAVRNRWLQSLEMPADLRAAELLGEEAEDLVTGLERLHRLERMPRRIDPKVEKDLTHPSLERRLESIRDAVASVPDSC